MGEAENTTAIEGVIRGLTERAVFIVEFRQAKIPKETAYWTQPSDAANWRSEWVERSD